MKEKSRKKVYTKIAKDKNIKTKMNIISWVDNENYILLCVKKKMKWRRNEKNTSILFVFFFSLKLYSFHGHQKYTRATIHSRYSIVTSFFIFTSF